MPFCACPHDLYCGHCFNEGRTGTTFVTNEKAVCEHHGLLTEKDLIAAYPDGHLETNHGQQAQGENK